jgi:hypothetical protein
MDIEKALDNFATKESLIQFIRDLPDDARGLMMFTEDIHAKDEDGNELQKSSFKYYGDLGEAIVVWMLLEFLDFVRHKV